MNAAPETETMETHTETVPGAFQGRTVVVAAAVAVLMTMCRGMADAQFTGRPDPNGNYCWRMTPFEDEIWFQMTPVGPPTIRFYSVWAIWTGNGHYMRQGGGRAEPSHNGTRLSVSFVFYNWDDYGLGNRIGQFSASIDRSTRKGLWTVSIAGIRSATPAMAKGLLVRMPCSQVGTKPPADPPNLALTLPED
jgi:hypothetical protein